MLRVSVRSSRFLHNLPFVLLAILLATLWIAGGASRADALGQVVVRFVAWLLVAVLILLSSEQHSPATKPIAYLLAISVALVALQLIPLPPELWLRLPGRSGLAPSGTFSNAMSAWRPLSLSPSATINALNSLIVPVVTLMLMRRLPAAHHGRLLGYILALVVLSAGIGLAQLTGAGFDNPLINDIPGQAGGTFANRNHFALWLACGCALAPIWAFQSRAKVQLRPAVAMGCLLLFVLVQLANGSRMGLVLTALALAIGVFEVRHRILGLGKSMAPRRRTIIALALGIAFASAISLALLFGRVASLDRALNGEAVADLRFRALPTILAMTAKYFPVGSGFGSFDPVFRIDEPTSLLAQTYLNHAHNDLLEVVLDGGLGGALLLVAAVALALRKAVMAWSSRRNEPAFAFARAGSILCLLTLVASAADYPARTPLVMALLTIAVAWLFEGQGANPAGGLAAKSGETRG